MTRTSFRSFCSQASESMGVNCAPFWTILLVLSVATLSVATLPGTASRVYAGPYVDAVLADNPVGYWRLEEGTGTAVDSAPLFGSQNGTYFGRGEYDCRTDSE